MVYMIIRARADDRRRKIEAEAKEHAPVGKAELHSRCVPFRGPHEMEDKQLPTEAENIGCEKVELAAIMPIELPGDDTYLPVEVDAGSMNKSLSSDDTLVNGPEEDPA